MPTQKIVSLYQYDELPTDEAKAKAREWFVRSMDESGDNFYAESVTSDFAAVCEAMGVDIATVPVRTMGGKDREEPAIFWSGFWSQGDGASFKGSLAAKPDAGEAIRAYAPEDARLHRIGDAFAALAVRLPELRADITREGRYVHEMTMRLDNATNGQEDDEGGYDIILTGEEEDMVLEPVRDLARWLYRQLESAYEEEREDETVEDNIRANEYTFTESGKRED